MLERFPDGVWQVEFAPVASDRLVGQTVAQVLGVSEEFEAPVSQSIVQSLQSKRLMLILDNCEHVLEGARELVSALLRGCPNVKVLATSRAPLGMWGEQSYRVPSLSMPDVRRRITARDAIGFEAVRLLVDRAMLHKPEFALTEQNATAMVKICSRLDGIPLALELAAARMRSMTAEDIHSRLDDRFRLLTGGDRSALPRQQTLRALIDWSYELLDQNEKDLLMVLSVFAGGWTLTAAEELCSGDGIERWTVVDLLSSLTEKSLVFLDEQHSGRYRLLESVRQYSIERLEAAGRADAVRARHRDAFLALAEQAEPGLTGPNQEEWLNRLEQEHDNLRAALAWCAQNEDGAEAGLRMSGALHRYWSTRGHLSEGREHLTRALAVQESDSTSHARAGALIGLGRLSWFQGDYPLAQRSFEDALSLYRTRGEKRGAAYALLNLGNVACNQGSFSAAESYNTECLQLYREVGDRFGIANAVGNLGNVASDQGDYDTARPLYEEGLKLQIELDNKIGIAAATYNLGVCELYQRNDSRAQALFEEGLRLFRDLQHRSGAGSALDNLGILALRRGDVEAARALFEECLRLRMEIGDKKGAVHGLEEMAAVCAAQSDPRRAARLWGAAKAFRESIGIAESSGEHEDQAAQLDRLRTAMGDGPFAAAMKEGRSLSLEDAVAEALGS